MRRTTDHLADGEAVLEVVEGNFIVVHVNLAEELLQDGGVDGKFTGQVQVDVHLVHQQQNLLVGPLPIVKRRHA